MAEPLIITDGNCRLVVDTDPGTHRLRVTMESLKWAYTYDDRDPTRHWESLGCVSMDRERAADLVAALDLIGVSA